MIRHGRGRELQLVNAEKTGKFRKKTASAEPAGSRPDATACSAAGDFHGWPRCRLAARLEDIARRIAGRGLGPAALVKVGSLP